MCTRELLSEPKIEQVHLVHFVAPPEHQVLRFDVSVRVVLAVQILEDIQLGEKNSKHASRVGLYGGPHLGGEPFREK